MAKKQKNYDDVMTPFVFPAGTTGFSHLMKPDEFPEGVFKYKVQVNIGDTPEWEETIKKLQQFQDDRSVANGKAPKPLTCIQTKNGVKYLEFHSYNKQPVVDKNNQPYDEEPWRGSIVRVFSQPEYYSGFGGGITLYMNKVQVVENTKNSGGGPSREDPFAVPTPPEAGEDPFNGI